jgi:hypothetical protein
MKLKAFSVSMLVAAFMIWGMSVSPLRAAQYLGEVTWDYSGPGGGTIKAAITKVSASYYEVQGQAANGAIIFAGGGALVNGKVEISATSTQVEVNSGGTYHNATTLRISIDPASYNGSLWMVTRWYNDPAIPGPSGWGDSYDSGTLTKTSGPANPAVVPQLPLMLQ